MKIKVTGTTEAKEIILEANRYGIETKVEDLMLFLTPLLPLSSDTIRCIKNLEALMDFIDECNDETLSESYHIMELLREYNGTFYRNMVNNSTLPLAKQMLLVNLHILYENANRLRVRCGVVTYDNETLNVLAKVVQPWIDAVIYTIKRMLRVIATEDVENIMDPKQYEALNQKVRGLNGEVISFYEIGM